jgi:hypothetical protein
LKYIAQRHYVKVQQLADTDMYDEGWNPQKCFNSLDQPYLPALHWKNPSFKLWVLMIKKMIIEHFHGASIIGLLPEGKLTNDDFIDYIKPVAKIYRVHAK